jgi:hypothetical protein
MNAILRLLTTIVAYGDTMVNNNPKLKFVDWNRDNVDLRVKSPQSVSYVVPANTTKLVFDGTRTLTVDGTTALSVSLVTGTADRYRFRHTAGTAPGFRTARALDLTGNTYSVVVNANGTATFTRTAGTASLAAIQVGDIVWIPEAAEAPSQPFDAANQGFWIAMAVTATTLTLTRDGDFEAANETSVAVSTALQVQAFAAAGVQVGDKLEVVSGFVTSTQRTFTIEEVTPAYLEVSASQAIAAESGIFPGASGFLVYTSAKRLVHVEADQEAGVRINGDVGNFCRLSPFTAGDLKQAASFQIIGPVWSLNVVNRSSKPMNVIVISAE